jgi:hypothetical protein
MVLRIGPVGEPSGEERAEQPLPAAVAGEHPAGAVPSMGRRGQTQHQKPGLRVPEAGHGFPPVVRSREAPHLFARHALAIGAKTRAARAGDDGLLQRGQ